jgi:lysyl-tRNA synthetase class 1
LQSRILPVYFLRFVPDTIGSGAGEAEVAHWADEIAEKIAASGRASVVSTGISPSGEIHIGNMREVLTGDAIFRALGDRGIDAGFNYVCDNFDPLRRVYPFLDAAVYESRIGQPLSDIPCPCGDHVSYADHYLEPFLEALRRLRIDVELVRADRLYKSGRMNPYIVQALEARERIAGILHELTGKQVAEDWSPFNVWCPDCRCIHQAKVRGFSAADETVDYRCACGSEGTVPMAGGGKLVWRIDWPARWRALGVTVEPFGKDHATRGGSYDTGVRVVREVFGAEPPYPIPYEWIRLRGAGDMSSSKGNVLSIGAMLEVVPPEVLRYLVVKERPTKTIGFDPGLPLLKLADEVDDGEAKGRDERAVELSRAAGFVPLGVPFKHLVVVAQAVRFDRSRVAEVLARTGYGAPPEDAIAERMGYVRNWLERFAPEDLKFEVQDELPAVARELDATQRAFLGRLADGLSEGLDGEAIHKVIYDLAGEFEGIRPARLFQAIYLALLGKARGPRAGAFIGLLGADFCARRFREAAEVKE